MAPENENGLSITDEAGAVVGILEDIGDQSALFAFNTVLEGAHAHRAGRFTPFSEKMLELAERAEMLAKEVAGMISGLPGMDRTVRGEPSKPSNPVSVLGSQRTLVTSSVKE